MNKRLTDFHQQLMESLAEISTRIKETRPATEQEVICYFTYSCHMSHNAQDENLCLASFHIWNMSNQRLKNPYICIQLPKDSPFTFTGKYLYEDQLQKMKNRGGWLRTNERENKVVFWLKPLEHSSIQPNERITFSDFQIKWTPTKSYAGSIRGFTYSEENKEGIAAINALNLSGTMEPGEGR